MGRRGGTKKEVGWMYTSIFVCCVPQVVSWMQILITIYEASHFIYVLIGCDDGSKF